MSDTVELEYRQTQNNIKKEIDNYNSTIDSLVEEIRDIQIKDLMSFNKAIE